MVSKRTRLKQHGLGAFSDPALEVPQSHVCPTRLSYSSGDTRVLGQIPEDVSHLDLCDMNMVVCLCQNLLEYLFNVGALEVSHTSIKK